jgi:EAL domain-containing protein (putative c-di-GMP-specific phosphodiesterase class I)
MRTGLIMGAEALIRWQHPERGLLLPGVFLPAIDDHPLAIEIGEWVIHTALKQLSRWHDLGLKIQISVNVGARQLKQDNFVDRLREILAAYLNTQPGDLQIEILETCAFDSLSRVSDVIEACRQLGVTFALDDFGTGLSSLSYLKRLPVAMLKIDQSFVAQSCRN